MNVVSRTPHDTGTAVAVVDSATDLSSIRRPGCAAAIWRRHVPPAMQEWLDAQPVDTLPRGRVTLPAQAVAPTVQHLCDISGLQSAEARDWLVGDIAGLAAIVSDLFDADTLRMRLDVVSTDACRRFHMDAIPARLICTYRGTGTQYGVSPGGHDPHRVFTAPTGAPLLLRGSDWPPVPNPGLLHRSPPIAGTGESRLVLVLDPAIGAEALA